MRDHYPSEEERLQREREERARMNRQEQAYREAQRSVYSRIYQDRDPEPEDYAYQDPYWEDPRDRIYEEERRRRQREEWDDPWPKPRARRPDRQEPPAYYDPGPETHREPARPPRRREDPEPPRKPPRRPAHGTGTPPPRRRGKKRKVLLIVLAALLVLLAAGLIVKKIYVRPPELPTGSTTEGVDPGSMGAGRKEDVYTFLLVGRDDKEGGGGNTDTIMVGCFDVKNGTLDVMSIYRDTLVDVPWEIAKINSVYNKQGIEGLQQQVKNLIGYQPDFYFVVELTAVAELVDVIGGVDYDVPYDMHYDDPTQDLHIHFDKGMQHLNGEDAVKLLRWRKNNSGEALSVGDVGRVEIQHSFLKSLSSQMLSLGNLTKIRDIAEIVDKNLTSNLSYGEMIWFGEQALKMQDGGIRFHNMPGDYTGSIWSPTYHNHQSYVFVNGEALRSLVNQYLNPYTTDITPEMQNIRNSTTVNNMPGAETDAGADTVVDE